MILDILAEFMHLNSMLKNTNFTDGESIPPRDKQIEGKRSKQNQKGLVIDYMDNKNKNYYRKRDRPYHT